MAHALANLDPSPLTALRTGCADGAGSASSIGRSPRTRRDRYQTAADLLSELRRIKRRQAKVGSRFRLARDQQESVNGVKNKQSVLMIGIATAAVGQRSGGSRVGLTIVARHRNDRCRGSLSPVQVAASVGEERLPSWSARRTDPRVQSDHRGTTTSG